MTSQPRSIRLRFVLAGVLLLAVSVAFWYSFECLKVRQQIALHAVQAADASGLLREQIGTPISTGYFVSGRVIGDSDGGTADLEIPISGPKGSGTLLDWSQAGFAGWHVCSMTFRPKTGADVILFPDEDAHCERE